MFATLILRVAVPKECVSHIVTPCGKQAKSIVILQFGSKWLWLKGLRSECRYGTMAEGLKLISH